MEVKIEVKMEAAEVLFHLPLFSFAVWSCSEEVYSFSFDV